MKEVVLRLIKQYYIQYIKFPINDKRSYNNRILLFTMKNLSRRQIPELKLSFDTDCVSVLTSLLASRFTRQVSELPDESTGLADTVDTSASKLESSRNTRINSNNLAGRFARRNCKQIDHFSIRSPTLLADWPILVH